MRLMHPLLIEVADDETMENVMADLAGLGFMNRYGFATITPWSEYLGWFYEENDTYPTHFMLTDASFDPVSDGLSVELCGQVEIEQAPKQLLDEDIREIDMEYLQRLIGEWYQF